MFCVHKRKSPSGRHFFYAPKTYAFIDCYLSSSKKFLFPESIVSKIYFVLASISKNRSLIFFQVLLYFISFWSGSLLMYSSTLFPPAMTCRLLSHLLIFLGSLNCKQYGPKSEGSSLVRVHSVCFLDKM